jgi:hypothetical protein
VAVTTGHFERLFKTDNRARDNYRARLFAIFSEEIVRAWSRNPNAPYLDIGRPTLWLEGNFATLDFTFERRADGARFIAEQKAELAWAGYSQLRLINAAQVARHQGKRAFDWFMDATIEPAKYQVKVAGRPASTSGGILVWGATTHSGRADAIAEFGFADVLSLETMLADVRSWNDAAWSARVAELRAWTDEMLDGLLDG